MTGMLPLHQGETLDDLVDVPLFDLDDEAADRRDEAPPDDLMAALKASLADARAAREARAAAAAHAEADRRDEARQAEVDACGCRACDPGWWADEDQFERSRDV